MGESLATRGREEPYEPRSTSFPVKMNYRGAKTHMTVAELLILAPTVVQEMGNEFVRRGTRNKIHGWFRQPNVWKAEHRRVDKFLKRLSGNDPELEPRWGMQSAVSHPTATATLNSTAVALSWLAPRFARHETYEDKMKHQIGDYIVCVGTLMVATTVDAPDWISLGCDDARMPNVEPFRLEAAKLLSGHRPS